ncbi:MAG: hypothetical protein HYY06_05905 [Deltaproteobacteria bacterium]|nr:hypothetical protein [Deltaproteobacteria bacterium]
MAICDWCREEMLDVEGCSGNAVVEFPDGSTKPSIPYGEERRCGGPGKPWAPGPGQRCHDCHVAVGERHHPGCDWEECPRCGHQLISCGCLDDEEEDAQPSTLH